MTYSMIHIKASVLNGEVDNDEIAIREISNAMLLRQAPKGLCDWSVCLSCRTELIIIIGPWVSFKTA